MKRYPIRSKVQRMVLAISFAALVITSAAGIISMLLIRSDSEKALIQQTEQNLRTITTSKAELADSELGKYSDYVQNFADYIHDLYENPSGYVPHEVLPPKEENAGVFIIQRTLRDKNTSIDSVKDELFLLGNLEQVWAPVLMSNKGVITTIYAGTESGFLASYDDQSDLSAENGRDTYYDYSGSAWYTRAKETGRVCFTDIYQDSYGRGMMISCAAPFYDAGNNFSGVVCMDILISDLHKAIVDIDIGENSFAFLVDGAGKIISPSGRDMTLDNSAAVDILAGKTGVSLADDDIYYAYTPIKSTGWKFCVRIPESVILFPVHLMDQNVVFTIILFLAAFVIIILIVAFVARKFSKRLTTPIIALGHDAEEISAGNLDHRAEIHSNDEIGDLAKNFNDMAASLKDYIKNLAAVTAEKERIGAELNVATQIQADMLPRIMPPYSDNEAFDLYASMNPAKEVGGDFYDFFLIDDNHLAMVMADVSGKGVPAALFMVIAKTLIKNRAMMGGTPGEILAYVNNQLCEGNEAELFVTVWLGILDLSTGTVKVSNAGHEYPAICRAGGKYELMITKHSPALATMEGLKFREHEFVLNPGDDLYIYTDGVPEATNIHDELYGTDRMLAALNATTNDTSSKVLAAVKKSVDDFTGEAPQFDDITMLCLQYFGKPETLTIDAKTERLDDVLDFVDARLEGWECPMKTITQINIAVEEIFVNIAHYAYAGGEGEAAIGIRRLGDEAEIIFTDSGTPYNPLEREDPDVTLSAEERQIGGLGIYIVKKSMDAVSYKYSSNKNILTIRKRI